MTNICYITDNGYVQHTFVSIASLKASKYPTSTYKVFVVCDKVDSDKKDMFRKFSGEGFEVEIVDAENQDYQKKDYELGKYISSSTYIRLRLPSILKGIDRVLYMDGDTIIQDDLTELFKIDMGDDYTIAGAMDFGTCISSMYWSGADYIKNTLPGYERTYVNAGVLVMELHKLRKNNFEERCKELYDTRKDFIFADQDIINFSEQRNIKVFPLYWNCQILNLLLNYPNHSPVFLQQLIKKTYHIEYKELVDIVYKSKVIHINGDKKYIHEIPYLSALYQRYFKLACEYIIGNAGEQT